ncbi:MAG: hypothetical protein ACD_73C00769G0002 [uncultured bacterium]|nr:MAG: hypothetical protein ACD_73C00769G0002 [uncultured bacterium]
MATVNLTIDGKQVSVEAGTTVIAAAKKIGIDIPHYCYHPGLSIVGNCRMCLVEVEKAPKPMIGCSTLVAEGMVVNTASEKVKKMRASVMEFLLINHPLDCPTCDQAGECRLQDYYMQYDQVESRFKENKVEKDKMVYLGANVMLDQERCVACTRCIRLCKEVAGVDELALAYRGDHVTITTFPCRPLSNAYAGNVVDVCPVGALTSKDFRFKKRAWFLTKTKSICPGCARGCNIEIHHEAGKVYRLIPRLNEEVNKYWMCDEGRYGYKPINENRVLRAFFNKGNQASAIEETSFEEALYALKEELNNYSGDEVVVIGHLHESNENLKALKEFAQNILKTNQLFYSENVVANPSQDQILISADKNPNRRGAEALGFEPLQKLGKARVALVLNNLSEADLKILNEKKITLAGLWAVNESALAKLAKVVMPIPSYAEQNGSFTNLDGKVQFFSQAFEPKGESRILTDYLNILTEMIKGSQAVLSQAV